MIAKASVVTLFGATDYEYIAVEFERSCGHDDRLGMSGRFADQMRRSVSLRQITGSTLSVSQKVSIPW